MRRTRGDEGYAIVAAVGALAVFASVSYAILAADRGNLAELRGEVDRAHLEAAAEAGLTDAIEGLATTDVTRRWAIDGRTVARSFDGDKLTITVEDERGKVPYVGLSADQLRRLFKGAGAPDDRTEKLVDAYQDWFDPDADPERHTAELARYAARGIRPPDSGGDGTLTELARLDGMDAATYAKIQQVLTPYFGGSGAFTPGTASPLAIETMSEQGADDPEVLERQQEIAGEVPALAFASEDQSMAGHAVTVVVDVDDPDGRHLERRTVVEFTGRSSPAFYVREAE
jgi:general secretion pathway protein K